MVELPRLHNLKHVIIRRFARSNGPKVLKLVGNVGSNFGLADAYEWVDGRPIFDTSRSHLRTLAAKSQAPPLHSSINRWARTCCVPDQSKVWKIWLPSRSEKENMFL